MAVTYGFLPLMTVAAASILVYVTAGWLLSLRLRDSGIMDVLWGPGFMLAAGVTAATAAATAPPAAPGLPVGGFPDRWMLVLAMLAIWALRLAIHIGRRNMGEPEDYRYAAWRREAGKQWWWRSYFKVFLLQGLVMLIVLSPATLVFSTFEADQFAPGWLALIGVSVWLTGFLFEAIGDEQLRRFKADPANAGKVMDGGLWRYTRHPNYFGESLIWFGVWIVACEVPWGWATIVSPLLMLFLLLRVSGVAMLERGLAETKPGYAEYVRHTSAFFPRPPKNRRK